MQITLVSSGDTVSDVLNRFQTKFSLKLNEIEAVDASKAITVQSGERSPVKKYWCPQCDVWMDRSGFDEILGSDFQEQLCKVCGSEVCHEFDQNSPAAYVQNEEISEVSLEAVSACAEVLDGLPVPIFDILLLADDCSVKERVSQIPPYLIDRAGNLFQKTAGNNDGFLTVYAQVVSKHLSNIAVNSGLVIKLMVENLEVSQTCICGSLPPFIIDRGGVYKRDYSQLSLAARYAQVVSEHLSNIVVV